MFEARIEEARRGERQNLRPKSFEKNRLSGDYAYKTVERRAKRDVGAARKVLRAANNAAQRDRYKRSRSGTKMDGTKNTIKPRKILGSTPRRKPSLRARIR